MAENILRQSQTVTSFGPGSMVDLPDHSVLIGGLDLWSSETSSNGWRVVDEPRLAAMLEKKLGKTAVQLRTPPVHEQNKRQGNRPFVGAVIFPLWFVCDHGSENDVKGAKRRRMVRWDDLEAPSRKTYRDGKTAVDVTPIRFVAACDRGHIQDIDWRWVVHRGAECVGRPLFLEERGTSGATTDLAVVCDCGARFALAEAYTPPKGAIGILGACGGHRPWLGDFNREHCHQGLKLLTRTASNAYFSQGLTVISIPAEHDHLTQMVQKHHETLVKAPSPEIIAIYRDANPQLRADLTGFSDQAVFAAFKASDAVRAAVADASPKEAEFAVLASGKPIIGEDSPGSALFAQTLERHVWDPGGRWDSLKRVVAIHRLREVIAQYGFTRFEAPAPTADGGVEEQNLNVEVAPIATDAISWLPAIEQFGEGLMLQFDDEAIGVWLSEPKTRLRNNSLLEGHELWRRRRFGAFGGPSFRGVGYYLAHSLAHALMAEIALDCGYPQSSLKERIYAGTNGLGLMIYTAAGDAEGTLGGLVTLAPRISDLLVRALERARLCSNDPLCADHNPGLEHDDRHLQGAACHGCLLAPETGCENRNDHLDRALLVDCLTDHSAPFFDLGGH